MSTARTYAPGLLLTTAAVALSIALSWALGPALGPLTVAILLGVAIANVFPLPESMRPGLRFCAKKLLRVGVVLLGLSVTFSEVAQLGWDGLLLLIAVVSLTFLAGMAAARVFRLRM